MIKIAFVHWNGLAAGGTEQFLQTVAANLPQDRFKVDFYYAGCAAQHRKQYMLEHGVNLIEFHFRNRVEKGRYTYFSDCDFDKVFTGDYDLVQAGRYGSAESFFECIRKIPIIDSVHYVSGVDNQCNISRVMHISEFSRNMWIRKGGDAGRVVMISLPVRIPEFNFTDIRAQLGLEQERFLFGFHQADRDSIFSDIPLRAYKEVENSRNAFVICNGSKKYRRQAKELGLKNVYFYDYIADNHLFYSIIKSFDVYAHGRRDGELNSAAIAEAMSFGLPVITHPSAAFNGHLEVIGDNGFIARDYQEYAQYMEILQRNEALRKRCGSLSRAFFERHYDFDDQMKHITKIYEDVLKNPYPNPVRRIVLGSVQTMENRVKRFVFKKIYTK
jgi:hypothetical protein